MPSRDDDGRELSGGEKRARALGTQAAIDAEERRVGDVQPAWAVEFERAGVPDLDDVGLGLSYVRKLQMIVIRQMAVTPFPGPAQRETWKRIQAMGATIGMTHNRAGVESEVKNLKAMIAERKQGTSFVTEESGSKIAKPSTARGQRRGGPRPIPADALPPDPTDADEEPEDPPAE